MNKILCFIFNHKWRYNFPSLPSKAICKRCKAKAKVNLKIMEWESVDKFEGETRTDQELINKWVP